MKLPILIAEYCYRWLFLLSQSDCGKMRWTLR